MDVRDHNRNAWNALVRQANRWTVPVSTEEVSAARRGALKLLLTPTKPVPMRWYPPLFGLPTLCLASGGGQQTPLLAAAGAKVTVLDNSPEQLKQDLLVAEREDLRIEAIQGDMADLSRFDDETFGMIFHPCSNSFVPDVIPVWQECSRVLRPGGVLLAGFTNGVRYIFDDERTENGKLDVRYPLPYSDLNYLDEPHLQSLISAGQPLEFGHTLEDQIGGQLRAGLLLSDLREDRYDESVGDPLSKYMATFVATRAIKPQK